jgi:hypothetical protein
MRLPQPTPRTLAQEIAAAIHRLAHDLDADRPQAAYWFRTWRSKEPVLDVLDRVEPPDGWFSHGLAALAELEPAAYAAVEAFYDEVLRFRVWVKHTEVMPATWDDALEAATRKLLTLADVAVELLGGVPPDPTRPTWPAAWTTLHRDP